MQSFASYIHKCYNFYYPTSFLLKMFFVYLLLRVNNTNKKGGVTVLVSLQHDDKEKFRLQTIIFREGTGASSNKSSAVKGITRMIREVDKSNLTNFDVAMLCALQNKGITLKTRCEYCNFNRQVVGVVSFISTC